jgi:hypothetical protein
VKQEKKDQNPEKNRTREGMRLDKILFSSELFHPYIDVWVESIDYFQPSQNSCS